MKKFLRVYISLFLSIFILTNSIFFVSAENIELTYSGGLIPDLWTDWEPYLFNEDISTYALPSHIDNSELFPSPGNQGNSKSCAAWALSYALKSSQEYLKRNWSTTENSHLFSPTYTYHKINNGENNGASFLDTLNSLISDGACPISYYPINNDNYNDTSDLYDNAAAALYKIIDFSLLTTRDQIKTQVAMGNGVVIGIKIYNDLRTLSETNDTYNYIAPNETAGPLGHAVCIVGYDNSKNAFKFINSWGTEWGIDGYGWISYDFVESSNINMVGSNYGIIIYTPDTDNYVMGDINDDGVITAADAQLALQISSQSTTFTPRQYVLADVDGNGTVTAADARNILNYSAGILTKFPLYE
ncbi:MAG: hypothetical protein IKM66_05900 [Clostridia bacterium]|nr:hypothetical protein [Clostridia bacterium]